MRLALLLSEHREAKKPKTYALLALACFHAARLSGRTDDGGSVLQLEMQDRSKLRDYPWHHAAQGEFHRLAGTPISRGTALNAR